MKKDEMTEKEHMAAAVQEQGDLFNGVLFLLQKSPLVDIGSDLMSLLHKHSYYGEGRLHRKVTALVDAIADLNEHLIYVSRSIEDEEEIEKKFAEKPFIVKVQVPIESNMPKEDQVAMVYNEDRSFRLDLPVKEVFDRMKGSPKKFFFAQFNAETKDLNFMQEAPWQTW